ncbi:MAG: exodeoxyribonuclease III, partial [Promicromonosporaceae bacterium]|nr:exodeoxyribonuclease III [Promicromonosporaceae bacterium]
MSHSLTIATLNVNGIRAAFRRGFGDWLTSRAPDILLLQETRAPVEVVHGFFPEWHVAVHPSQEKGRAGVAI